MLDSDLENLTQKVSQIAEYAGHLLLKYYHEGNYQVKTKSDATPVTEADLASHDYIVSHLGKISPFPIYSEEDGEYLNTEIGNHRHYWLVDPLDGTSEFIKGSGEFSVNISLIEDQKPIMGVVFQPTESKLYFASKKHGAFIKKDDRRLQKIKCRKFQENDFTLLVSRRHEEEKIRAFKKRWPGCHIKKLGSSLKICHIAEGFADLYIQCYNTCSWDTAAAQCILEEAGGKIVKRANTQLTYHPNRKINPQFWAIGDQKTTIDFIRSHDKCCVNLKCK